MKEFIQTLKNIWSLKELRDKIIFTLGIILVYRFASYISLPAINLAEVGDLLEHYKNQGGNKQGAGLLGLLSSFTGGGFQPRFRNGVRDHALYFCFYYCSVDGDGYSLSSEASERWRVR
jgi:hypothetical protein